jgi:gliding motility-associated-like protein
VTVTDAQGCSANTAATIIEPLALMPGTSGGAVSCFGGNDAIATASATGGISPYTFLWSTGQTSAQASGLSAGPYSVTLTDAQGCSATTTGNIPEPGLLVVNTLAGTVSCFGGNNASASASTSGGTSPYNFLWSNGQTTAQIGGLSAGSYTVTATDAHGCTAVQWATVDQSALLVSTAFPDETTCFGGNDGAVSIQSNGGQAPYQYQWSNGQTGTSISGLPAGPYSVTITDAFGCTTLNTALVNQPPQLTLSAAPGAVSCFGHANGTLNASLSGGTGPYTIEWSNGQNGFMATGLLAGTYSLTATDAHGCTGSSIGVVNTPTALQSSTTTQDPACFGSANGLATLHLSGGTPPYSYQWQNGQTGTSAQQLSAGNYQVTATDAQGCTQTNSVSLGQPTAVSGTIQALEAGCFGAATGQAWVSPVGGTPPYTFTWQNGETTAQISGLPSGWYGLTITDAHQCPGTAQIWVGQPWPLLIDPFALPVSCPELADGMASATASGGVAPYSFAWSNGQSGPEISALAMGAYTVTATDAHGCTAVAEETVETELPIEVDLGLDQTFFLGDELVLTAHTNLPPGEILDYSWSGTGGAIQCADCFQYQFVPLESGCERVLVTSVHGCQASDEVCFKLRPGRHIYVPNVFHPDDSGDNDFFTIYSDASVKQILYLNIYNRWGEQLFQANNIQTNHEPSGWDGNFRGNPMNPGVFVWVAEVEFIDGEVVFLKGDVTLVR